MSDRFCYQCRHYITVGHTFRCAYSGRVQNPQGGRGCTGWEEAASSERTCQCRWRRENGCNVPQIPDAVDALALDLLKAQRRADFDEPAGAPLEAIEKTELHHYRRGYQDSWRAVARLVLKREEAIYSALAAEGFDLSFRLALMEHAKRMRT